MTDDAREAAAAVEPHDADRTQTEIAAPVAWTAVPGRRTPRRTAHPTPAALDLRAPDLYLSRELTWLSFNKRVLNEARDPRTPLLERVKFLAISDSNLDEFFMKRIGGLKQQVGAGVHNRTVDGRTPLEQLQACRAVIAAFRIEQRQVYLDLMADLARHDIRVVDFAALPDAEKQAVRAHYLENVFPLLTPLAMDPAHPFPFISNLSINLLVSLRFPDAEKQQTLARVKVPMGSGVSRFIRLGDRHHFVLLGDVIAHCLEDLFPGMLIDAVERFRVTRNANTERDEDKADDLMAMIEAELRDRRFAPIVRLEVDAGMHPFRRGMLAAELGLSEEEDVYESDIMVGLRDLMELAQLDIPALHDTPHKSITNVKLRDRDNIFHVIREIGPILLHHPYESFATSVTRFVREAATDPKVSAIKMTLYRTSADTQIIDHLIEAAQNGKQVAVAVELKARFDEAANIRWAGRMEEAGIHVTYGVLGLKTHAKAILVVRRDYNGLRRYAHIGTGNYHAGTARLYCDFGLLTCDPDIGQDLSELFNYLTTGCRPARSYRKILAAPHFMKKGLIARIDREIALHAPDDPGLVRFKCNGLEDPDVIEALYRASRAGVRVQLIVRDSCRFRAGLPDVSESAAVLSIVGRFLEHARVYHFRNGGADEYYIGSADLMTRNLESRVEVLVPIEAPELTRELNALLETQWRDQRSAWDMQSDGTYVQRQPQNAREAGSCQEVLITAAALRSERSKRLHKSKPRTFARRLPK